MPAAGGGTKMTAKSATLPARLLRYLGNIVRLAVLAGIYALVLFYLNATAADLDTPPIPTKITIALIALGITGSIYHILAQIAAEAKGGIMVIAAFLNTHLLEPRKQRLRAEGFSEGLAQNQAQARAEGFSEGRSEGFSEGRSEGFSEGLAQSQERARSEGFDAGRNATLSEVRSFLQEHGLDLDLDEIPLPDAGDTESKNAERC